VNGAGQSQTHNPSCVQIRGLLAACSCLPLADGCVLVLLAPRCCLRLVGVSPSGGPEARGHPRLRYARAPLGMTDDQASRYSTRGASRTQLRRDLTDLIGVPGLV
jgi:hypothetical protein